MDVEWRWKPTEAGTIMKRVLWSLAGLLGAVSLAIVLVAVPVAGVCVTPAGVYIQGWWSPVVRWLFWPIEFVVCAGCFLLFRFADRNLSGGRLGALAPLAWLPALVALPHGLASVDHTLAGIVLPLGGTFLAAVCVERLLRPSLAVPSAPFRHPLWVAWVWFVLSALLLGAYHFGVSSPRSFGGGDAKHYWLQSDNLLERGTLDLTEWATAQMAAARIPDTPAGRAYWLRRSHMRINSEGRIYSYHTFGFPLLLWLFRVVLGSWGRGVLLALLGAVSLCGVRSACLAHGARRTAAEAVALLTGLSYMWVYTAMSCLPEMLGFGLVAWAFWAVAAQNRPGWRWIATCVAALTCSYLPLAHIRFTPTAGMLALAFGIEGLCLRDEPFWRRKVPRLAVFSVFCFACWGAFWAFENAIFRGTAAYNYSDIAGRTPLVIWAMFSDRRGAVSLVPGVSAFLVSLVAACFRRDATARRAVMGLVVVGATLWFCCCTTAAMGGACLNGRYFYTIVPVFLPFFAIALEKAARPGRLWMLFLALLPVLYFLFLPWFLAGSRLLRAPAPARGLMNLALLWEPFPSFFGTEASPPPLRVVGSLFALSLFGLSALACTRRGPAWGRTGAAVFFLVAAFVCGRLVNLGDPPGRIGPFDILMEKRHFHDFRVLGPHAGDFFASFRESCGDIQIDYVMTDDDSRSSDDFCRVQHPDELPATDWRKRPLRWGKAYVRLRPLCKVGGVVACRATGRVVRGRARLALQIGGVPDAADVVLEEGPFDVVFRTPIQRKNEGVNFRLALENDVGEAYIATTEYAPCPDGLADLLGGFPASSTVVDEDYSQYLR